MRQQGESNGSQQDEASSSRLVEGIESFLEKTAECNLLEEEQETGSDDGGMIILSLFCFRLIRWAGGKTEGRGCLRYLFRHVTRAG
jgi:hypothetical protein